MTVHLRSDDGDHLVIGVWDGVQHDISVAGETIDASIWYSDVLTKRNPKKSAQRKMASELHLDCSSRLTSHE